MTALVLLIFVAVVALGLRLTWNDDHSDEPEA